MYQCKKDIGCEDFCFLKKIILTCVPSYILKLKTEEIPRGHCFFKPFSKQQKSRAEGEDQSSNKISRGFAAGGKFLGPGPGSRVGLRSESD